MPGIAAWWCKGAWEKAAALAKIPDSTTAAGPCGGASDDPEKDHYCGRATDYSNGLDPS